MKIGEITSGEEYRTGEQFQNLLIFRIFIVSPSFKILKIR